jgi:hypothetical protein
MAGDWDAKQASPIIDRRSTALTMARPFTYHTLSMIQQAFGDQIIIILLLLLTANA